MSRRYLADDVAVIWVQCSQDVLDQRCDARVDKMMEAGMLQEMIDFQKEVAQAAIEKDNPKYTNGIFQTIGFKEFHEYLHSDNKTKEVGRFYIKRTGAGKISSQPLGRTRNEGAPPWLTRKRVAFLEGDTKVGDFFGS